MSKVYLRAWDRSQVTRPQPVAPRLSPQSSSPYLPGANEATLQRDAPPLRSAHATLSHSHKERTDARHILSHLRQSLDGFRPGRETTVPLAPARAVQLAAPALLAGLRQRLAQAMVTRAASPPLLSVLRAGGPPLGPCPATTPTLPLLQGGTPPVGHAVFHRFPHQSHSRARADPLLWGVKGLALGVWVGAPTAKICPQGP